ncbi:MAG: hypothetical protein GTO60_16690 [Gammaproteobacteria bacterium]|nr:hypothetical protein [Gammaproteobacteria bacterium]
MAATIQVKAEAEKRSFQQINKLIAGVNEGFDAVAKSASSVAKRMQSATDAMKKMAQTENQFAREIAQSNAALGKQVDLLQQTATAPQRGGRRADEIDLGMIGTGGRTVGGAVGRIGGGIGGELDMFIATLSELPDVFEDAPRMIQNAERLGETLAKQGGIMGRTAQAGASLSTALPGVSAGMGSILAIALPLAGAVAAATFAMSELNKANERAKEVAERAQAATEARISQEVAIEQLLAQGKTEEAIARTLQLQDESIIKTEELARLQADAVEKETESFTEQVGILEAALAAPFAALAAPIGITIAAVDKLFTTSGEAAEQAAEDSVTAAEKAAEETTAAFEGASSALSEAGIDISQATAQSIEREKELTAERERAESAIAGLQAQEADLIAKRNQQLADQAQDRAMRDRREQEDFAETRQQHQKRLVDIEKDGAERIEDIRNDAIEKEAEIVSKGQRSISDVIADSQNKLADLRQDFNDQTIQRERNFQQRMEQLRQDFESREFDAILNNNIIAAMQAQRDFEQNQQREQEAFRQEQDERKAQRDERLQEIRIENEMRVQEIQASIQEELNAHRAATQERIQEEKAAISERVKAERESQDELEKQRRKRLKRQEEDDALADERALRAHEEALRQIQEKEDAERKALKATFDVVEQGTASTIDGIAQANQAAIKVTEQAAVSMVNAVASAVNKVGSKGAPGRADGGRVQAGKLYRVNERGVELLRTELGGKIIPLTDRRARGGGNTMVFAPQVSVAAGDFANPQQVVTIVQNAIRQVYQQDNQAIADALAGT